MSEQARRYGREEGDDISFDILSGVFQDQVRRRFVFGVFERVSGRQRMETVSQLREIPQGGREQFAGSRDGFDAVVEDGYRAVFQIGEQVLPQVFHVLRGVEVPGNDIAQHDAEGLAQGGVLFGGDPGVGGGEKAAFRSDARLSTHFPCILPENT